MYSKKAYNKIGTHNYILHVMSSVSFSLIPLDDPKIKARFLQKIAVICQRVPSTIKFAWLLESGSFGTWQQIRQVVSPNDYYGSLGVVQWHVCSRLQTAVLTHAPRMLPSTSAVRSLRAHDSDFVAQPLAAGESGTSFAHAHVRSFLAGFRLQSTSGQGDKTTALLGFCQRRASGLRRSGFFSRKGYARFPGPRIALWPIVFFVERSF